MTCNQCPLLGRPKIPGRGKTGGLAVIGEVPGRTEIQQGTPFVGQSGRLLRHSLLGLGYQFDQIWVTNAVLCSPPGNATPSVEAIEACRPRLIEELSDCSKALLCGAVALQSLAPNLKSGILQIRGRLLQLQAPDIPAVPTVHPALVLREPFYFTDFARDLTKIARLDSTSNIDPPPCPTIRVCSSIRDVRSAVADLQKSSLVSVDLETTGLDPLVDHLLLLGLQGAPGLTYQIPGKLLYNHQVVDLISTLFQTVPTCGHNVIGFDSKWVKYHLGIDWRPQIDTLLAHYTLDERSRDDEGGRRSSGIHGLKTLARDRYNAPDYDQHLTEKLKKLTAERRKLGNSDTPSYQDLDPADLSEYLAQDTLYSLLLGRDLPQEMAAEGTQQLYTDLLAPAALALRDIELTGVLIDPQPLRDADFLLQNEAEENLSKLRNLAKNPTFNANSPKQVGAFLFDTLKLPQMSDRSTSREALLQLESRHPAVRLILDYRQTERLRSTYIQGILARISADGRLRTEFLLHGTRTGRLSSRNPNLQNIPILIGPVIRNAFIATPGWTMIEADYNQLELRVAAWYSQDELLLKYYRENFDVHRMVASEVFNVPPEAVTSKQRYIAKYIDFGILYGRQAASLAHGELQCSVQEAQSYIDSFLGRFAGLALWIKKVQQQVDRDGYIVTPFGRRRRFPFLCDANRAESYRQAVNSPIQSLASDLCLTALTRLHSRFDPQIARVLLTVHDSILMECRTEYLAETCRVVREEMEDRCPIESSIRFQVDIKTGSSWGSLS